MAFLKATPPLEPARVPTTYAFLCLAFSQPPCFRVFSAFNSIAHMESELPSSTVTNTAPGRSTDG